jgi:hypothetical protein
MDTSVGLKDIRPQGIPNPKSHVVILIHHLSSRPNRKRKKTSTFRKGNRLDSMKMDAFDFFLPMLGIDMNLKVFIGHSSTEIH